MKNLAVIYDDTHLKHSPPYIHPENPERTKAVINFLNSKKFFEKTDLIKPVKASKENILLVHTEAHYNFVVDSIATGKHQLDADTYITAGSLDPALYSAGAVIMAVDLVMNNSYKYVFSLMRPPGHHAESNRPMGFCLFNNLAIGVKYIIDKYNLTKVAIIDWDVHHGNGTQEIFYNSNQVYFISLHQYPFYPGTGAVIERGNKEGDGFTLNFPLSAGTKGEAYLKIFNEDILNVLEEYNPQIIFISAGFDAHKNDPLANMELIENDFAEMTGVLKNFADYKNIKIISVLEGGYNLNALAHSVYSHLEVLKK